MTMRARSPSGTARHRHHRGPIGARSIGARSIGARLIGARLIGAGLVAMAACRPELEVAIETSVGGRGAQHDPGAQLRDVRAVAEALLRPAAPSTTAAAVPDGPARPPESAADLGALTQAIRKGALDEVGGPARRIAAAPHALWPEIRAALQAPRRAPKGDYRSMLAAIGGDVPNRHGHFDLAWKQAHGFSVKRSEDWFEDLLTLPRGRVSPVLTPVYRDVVLQTALLRATAEIGKNPAVSDQVVDVLLDVAFLHEGTFRDEVTRTIGGIGDEAVAALMRATILGDDPGEDAEPRAQYAVALLDRMDRWIPERAEAALRTEPRRIAALLEAWGDARNGNAAPIMLAHADAQAPAVRAAARRAFGKLVDGPMPKTISRRVRLLGGGTGKAQAFLNHRQLAAIAVRDALVREGPAALERPCEPPPAGKPVDPSCDAQPSRHAAALFERLDARRRAESNAAIEAALAAADPTATQRELDRLLAERPELGDDPRVAAAYRQGAAAALAADDALLGATLSRKAAVLLEGRDAQTAQTLRLQALLAEADSGAVPRWGRQMLLRTADALRPGDSHVAAALAATPSGFDATRTLPADRLALGCACVVLAFACVGGVTRRRDTTA